MSGVVPTAPEQPASEMENQIKSQDPRPDAVPDYNSHFVPGPPGPASFPPAGYQGGLPLGYYSPQHPSTFPMYQPTGRTQPIQYQPGKYPVPNQYVPVTWMPVPTPMPNCPPGLECLAQLDNIHVLQHFEPLEMVTDFETNNRYDVKNNSDQMVYIVSEDTDDFARNAYRTLRPFVLRVTDCMGREIMTMQRPYRCTCCCFCCPSARQEITSLDGMFTLGDITRKWNGLLSAMADADHFDIHFPLDLDVKMKAMIFGACFLIDFMYFERSPTQNSGS
ncbi:phospholipid scramblase 4 isoform X2 [Loxodonta africana]|uniref:phospholipid scramblase 4 isoform X2 n=1 Tax=Loxodonta africana TaxID=9785 RepID=UPI000C814273|nr:phospholipid scramblase 4 isoform X2 [Loxodonta africana]